MEIVVRSKNYLFYKSFKRYCTISPGIPNLGVRCKKWLSCTSGVGQKIWLRFPEILAIRLHPKPPTRLWHRIRNPALKQTLHTLFTHSLVNPCILKTTEVGSYKNEVDTSLLVLPKPYSSSALGSVFSKGAHKSLSSTSSILGDVLQNLHKFAKLKSQKYKNTVWSHSHSHVLFKLYNWLEETDYIAQTHFLWWQQPYQTWFSKLYSSLFDTFHIELSEYSCTHALNSKTTKSSGPLINNLTLSLQMIMSVNALWLTLTSCQWQDKLSMTMTTCHWQPHCFATFSHEFCFSNNVVRIYGSIP